jgi:transcriptional regulator with XRE-family HTH domain
LREQLREAIRESGQTLGQISRNCGVGPDRLSRFLRGERDLTLTGAEKICDALGLQLATRSGLTTREEQKAGYAKNAEMPNGQPAFQQERSRHVVSDTRAGAEEAASAFGHRPASPGENVHIALDPELAGLIQWFEANLPRLPQEPFRLFEWSELKDPKGWYEHCKVACETINGPNPTETPEWLHRHLTKLRELFAAKLI